MARVLAPATEAMGGGSSKPQPELNAEALEPIEPEVEPEPEPEPHPLPEPVLELDPGRRDSDAKREPAFDLNALRAQLLAMDVRSLRNRALADHISDHLIEEARDADDPKSALIDLIVTHARPNQVSELDIAALAVACRGEWVAACRHDENPDDGVQEERFVLSLGTDGALLGHHTPDTDPAMRFKIRSGRIDPPTAGHEYPRITFVQEYIDPHAAVTRWSGYLVVRPNSSPAIVDGTWFIDSGDDGVRDDDEVGGTFHATLVSAEVVGTSGTATHSTSVVNDPALEVLAQKFDRLAAGSQGGKAVHRDHLADVIPGIAASAFGKSVLAMLTRESGSDEITKENFLNVLSRFAPSSPLDVKLRAMFDLFSGGSDVLTRAQVEAFMQALYADHPHGAVLAEGMAGGLMQALGKRRTTGAPSSPRGTHSLVITCESFAEAAKEIEDVDAILTLVKV